MTDLPKSIEEQIDAELEAASKQGERVQLGVSIEGYDVWALPQDVGDVLVSEERVVVHTLTSEHSFRSGDCAPYLDDMVSGFSGI